ncbi:geminin coiled-coil domain-containing protein 1 [Melanotaenia boesemani]|uniref:geminin coiled-coil domain-containing protein 1 n=1 Tax=Melanotaenia boesemani TaxID=1250792 RepID=UPI001C04ECA0|nr:geminin coiled-coil domain-containing protein 1 [Melanotaenia boesemani]
METLASIWAHDPSDLCDLAEKRHKPPVWDPECVFDSFPPAGLTWMQQLSPHLQRNKQLQDTLLQREEELARLQEENNKLRNFLGSSFVRNLQQKAKKITDGRRKLKRNLTYLDDEPFQVRSSKQVSKRVCRNLTADFCSETSEKSVCSEPNLDRWVLRTLGLKDRDTIDTSCESLSEYSLRGLVYDAATSSPSTENTSSSSFGSPVTTSTPSHAHSYCQRSTLDSDYRYAEPENPAKSTQNCITPPRDATATGLTGDNESVEAVIGSYNISAAFQSDRPETCRVQPQEENPEKHLLYWSSLQDSQTPTKQVSICPVMYSSPTVNQFLTPAGGCSPTGPPAASQPSATLQKPRNRTDLAFSMSLSPSSSVKTHSFPHGQAFIRRDTGGGWNFTWMPRQEP